MNATRSTLAAATAVVVSLLAACGSNPGKSDGYNAFLQAIAAECKPLIIGDDNIGQAIVFNGLGAVPENYNNFLAKTQALYRGDILAETYRNSLTTFLGGGTRNGPSFDCIIAHLPAPVAGQSPTPAK